MKLAVRKNALTPPPPPPVVYSTDRSKAVIPVLVLLFVALWFILRGDLFYILPCVILFLCFLVLLVLLALRLPLMGKRELVGAFRAFVRFALIWFCLFPLPVGVWERIDAVCDCGTPWTFLLPFFYLNFGG